MLELLRRALNGGVKTSEFWLSAIAIVLPYADTAAQNAGGKVGVVASAAVAAAYVLQRGYVKGKAAQAAAPHAASESAHEIVKSDTSAALPISPR